MGKWEPALRRGYSQRALGNSKINIFIPKGDCTIVNSARDKPMKQSPSNGCEVQWTKRRKQKRDSHVLHLREAQMCYRGA